jgi:hypothetical protein
MDIENINTDYIIILLLFIIVIINFMIYIKKYKSSNNKLIDNFENQNNLTLPYDNMVTVFKRSDAIKIWGNWLANTNFPDKCADYIWFRNVDQNEPVESYRFSLNCIYDYKPSNINNNNDNNDNDNEKSFLYVICDDSCIVYHNNVNVGTCIYSVNNFIPPSNIIPLTLQPGLNYFNFFVANTGGPAGFLCTVIDSYGKVLFNSNKSWTFTNHGVPNAHNITYSLTNTC